MKTKIVKIIIMLVVSVFLSAGVSMAHAQDGKQYKSHAKAYGYHKYQQGHGHHPGWQKKNYKSYHPGHRPKNRYHKRYYHRRYKRSPRHDGFFFGMSVIDPYMALVVGANAH